MLIYIWHACFEGIMFYCDRTKCKVYPNKAVVNMAGSNQTKNQFFSTPLLLIYGNVLINSNICIAFIITSSFNCQFWVFSIQGTHTVLLISVLCVWLMSLSIFGTNCPFCSRALQWTTSTCCTTFEIRQRFHISVTWSGLSAAMSSNWTSVCRQMKSKCLPLFVASRGHCCLRIIRFIRTPQWRNSICFGIMYVVHIQLDLLCNLYFFKQIKS